LYLLVRFHVKKLLEARDAVEREKAHYQAMVTAIGDGVSVQDSDFRIIYQNSILKEMTGNHEGKHCFMAYEGKPEICNDCPLRETFLDGEVHKAERCIRNGESDRFFQITASPIRDSQGAIVAGLEIVREITDQKNMEERVTQSERKFRMLFDYAPDAIFIHLPEGGFVEANEMATEWLGYPHEQLLSMLPGDLTSPDRASGITEKMDEVLMHGSLVFETGTVASNGRIIPTEVKARVIQFEGQQAVLCYCRDITERKQSEKSIRESEQRWQFALEGSGDGVWDWDIASGKVFYSDRWKSILGFEPDDFDDDERLWEKLVHPDDREWVGKEIQRHLRGETPMYMTEHRLHCRDGSFKWILDRGKVLQREEDGTPLRMVGTYADITDRKRMENQLRQAQKMEAVGELASGIAHDFNNILTAIIGRIYLLQTRLAGNSALLVHADQIAFAAERAANLTQSLLAFSREQIINPRRIHLNETVKKSAKLFSKLVREDIEISMTLTEPDPVILADEVQIEQVLINLVANARDAIPGNGRILIATESTYLDELFVNSHGYGRVGDYAILSVSDTGTGMDQKTRERIFEPFFTTKEVGKGTGLGLAIVYGTVKQHNGHINVYSEIGVGTTIKIYLPQIEADADQEVLEKTTPTAPGGGVILLAEDEDAVRTLIKTILLEQGYKIIEAENGVQAVEQFQRHRDEINLVLLDVIMPRMNGKEACEEILRIKSGTKVLFMSGYTGDILGQQGLLSQGYGLIQKPLKPRDMLTIVRDMLEQGSTLSS
ncbi:MAG: PAS domain S-box protein, partial [Geobacteraceae bacterium]|nr:PAS domain S-box protein [Geobacteraceae bacterium]